MDRSFISADEGRSRRRTNLTHNGKSEPNNGLLHANGNSTRTRSRSRKTMLGRSIVLYEKDFKPQEWDSSELFSEHENLLNESKETSNESSRSEGFRTPKYYRPLIKKESPPGAIAKYYRQFGFFWNVFPKTDYTYSPSSPYYGMEVAPGIPVIPNLSRRSLHSASSFQRTTTAVTQVCTTVIKTVTTTIETVITTILGTRTSTHESRSPWLRLLFILLLLLPLLYFLFPSDDYHEKESLKESKSYLLALARQIVASVNDFTSILFRTICMIPTLSLQVLYLIQSFISSSFESMRVNSSSIGKSRPMPKVLVSYSEKSSSEPVWNEESIRKIVLSILKEKESQMNDDIDLRFNKVKSLLESMVNDEMTIMNMKTQEELRHVIRQGITDNPFPSDKIKEILNEAMKEKETRQDSYIRDLIEKYLKEASEKENTLKEQNKNYFLALTREVENLKSSKLAREDLLKEMSTLTTKLTILQDKIKTLEKTSLSAQVKREEAVKFEETSGSTDMNVREYVGTAINEALSKYHADRTGKPDFALLTNGGYIVSIKCTSYYGAFGFFYLFNLIKAWDIKASPNTILQPGILPGECYPFEGANGFFVIQLAHKIKVEGFTLEHMPKELSIYGNIDSAPKDFSVYALESEEDPEPVLLGRFQFLDNGDSLQYFEAIDHPHPVSFVELRVETNHGNLAYTCLYRFRVHGQKWPDTEEPESKDKLNL